MDGDLVRYRAFISYSHRDAAFGRRLHRRLERYGLPARLVGRTTARGAVPRRLAPIFRDREELSAAGDLTAEVRAALAASDALIVVCSPAAAASPWVAREVELFRGLHPDRPVLAVVAAGDPALAFPDALRTRDAEGAPVEPLAADFRPEGDGPRLGLLKLVAGVVGLGLDELIQRDAQRRLRGVMAVTVAALIAVLAMGTLTIFALASRAEAQRQRAEAEALVEFMLTDLRDRLKGVGRLDVLTAVNARALGYYADQDLQRLPADSLERRARALHAMGEDDEARGDMAAASTEFREARRTTGALLADLPGDPERIFNHAQSEYWVAFIDWRRHRFAQAEAGFQRYADLAQRLLAIDANNPDWRMEAGYAENNLGMVALRDRDDPAAAEARFKRALVHFQAAVRAKPADADLKRELADGYGWLADSQRALRHFGDARASRRQEAAIIAALAAADPKNSVYIRDHLGNDLGLGLIDLDDGKPTAARARLVRTYAEAAKLAAADPENAWRAKQKLATGLFLAKAILADGGSPGAVTPYLADCGSKLALEDEETRDFCAIIAARVATARGVIDPSLDYLRRNEPRLRAIHRSPRWGIDFNLELEFTKANRKEH
ncbi:TIR domain-containing protein [Phenylobacterium sp.]|uniref:TIR domain-containing protein n=1 Tax=Phenylobacterium sp. TaxID=1871053 RepID=UPI0027285B5D|nr:TIR domain-containing protein [Phenylobacterium sp.]MDO8801193.1 TIR domain-containing protein [Phenylobacterium sp.]